MRSKTEHTVLKTLAYFDLFNYPITTEEILQFHEQKLTKEDLEPILQKLITDKKIWRLNKFYSLQDDLTLAERRLAGNKRADTYLDKATTIVKTLSKFPYVRAVGVSGSVSKNFADEHADIDYFVITKENRLWIARTFMHLFKKIPFLKDRNRFYCMNYFIDESQLKIEEQNIYTATELVTLIPMYGNGVIENFYEANPWAFKYFPNYKLPVKRYNSDKKESLLKTAFEKLFNNKIGNWLDDYFFKLTTKRWKLKEDQQRLNTKGERMGLKTSKHFSKPNPIFFHDKFMSNYLKKIENLQKERLEEPVLTLSNS